MKMAVQHVAALKVDRIAAIAVQRRARIILAQKRTALRRRQIFVVKEMQRLERGRIGRRMMRIALSLRNDVTDMMDKMLVEVERREWRASSKWVAQRFKGTFWDRTEKRWTASILLPAKIEQRVAAAERGERHLSGAAAKAPRGRRRNAPRLLGHFNFERDAAEAFDAVASLCPGRILNFPKGWQLSRANHSTANAQLGRLLARERSATCALSASSAAQRAAQRASLAVDVAAALYCGVVDVLESVRARAVNLCAGQVDAACGAIVARVAGDEAVVIGAAAARNAESSADAALGAALFVVCWHASSVSWDGADAAEAVASDAADAADAAEKYAFENRARLAEERIHAAIVEAERRKRLPGLVSPIAERARGRLAARRAHAAEMAALRAREAREAEARRAEEAERARLEVEAAAKRLEDAELALQALEPPPAADGANASESAGEGGDAAAAEAPQPEKKAKKRGMSMGVRARCVHKRCCPNGCARSL